MSSSMMFTMALARAWRKNYGELLGSDSQSEIKSVIGKECFNMAIIEMEALHLIRRQAVWSDENRQYVNTFRFTDKVAVK